MSQIERRERLKTITCFVAKENKNQLLLSAARDGDTSECLRLILSGVSVNCRSPNTDAVALPGSQSNPLHLACLGNHDQVGNT
jgi:hypothetical protein